MRSSIRPISGGLTTGRYTRGLTEHLAAAPGVQVLSKNPIENLCQTQATTQIPAS
jgi:hypothetical protein